MPEKKPQMIQMNADEMDLKSRIRNFKLPAFARQSAFIRVYLRLIIFQLKSDGDSAAQRSALRAETQASFFAADARLNVKQISGVNRRFGAKRKS